ncbi:MAG: rhodanese-like domain-containing protein, partial [Kiloniellales bacterium]
MAGDKAIPTPLSPREVKRRIHGRDEVALLDLREAGQYGEGHPFLAVPLPYSRLELLAPKLLPRRSTPLILLDQNDGVAERAARRLAALGYSDISKLDGGAPAWAAAGYTLFKGVNLPSKTLGELVERELHVPSLTVEQLAAMKAEHRPLLQLDGRPLEEYRRFTVPGALCCPNAELAHRLPAFGAGPETPVVVSCAGRTRSIVGAASLIAAGFSNPVYALENGTQGWALAGWELERGADRLYPRELSPGMLAASRARGSAMLEKYRIPTVDAATLADWRRDETRTLYLLDVRTPEEFAAGHFSGAVSAPGGQLVQATDLWVAVRNARVLLLDDTGLRAALAARWLRAMGHEAHVFDPEARREDWRPRDESERDERGSALPLLEARSAPDLRREIESGAMRLLDLRPSMTARRGMLAGARWSIRPRLV